MKIFVTGSTGLIGIHLINKLLELGHEVYALIRSTSNISDIRQKDKIHFIKGDILDINTIEEKLVDIDIIIHCAARTSFVSKKGSRKYKMYEDNIIGTKNMADVAVKKHIKQFIYISSCSAMGDCYNGERDETFLCQPDSDYGRSKFESERILNEYRKLYNLPVTILRPGLIYGPYDRSRMKKMIEYIDKGKFVIFGNGKNQKSIVSVHNVVESIKCALANSMAINEVFIVTDGKNYSLNEISDEIAKLLGRKENFLHIPKFMSLILGIIGNFFSAILGIELPISIKFIKALMVSNTYNSTKLIQKLNYNPKVSFYDGIREELEWYKKIKRI